MSRPIRRKCLTCSHLTTEEARRLHGPKGDQCWDDLKCHKRRSHYRHRRERNVKRVSSRQSKNQSDLPEIIRLPTDTPQVGAILILYLDEPHHSQKITSVHAVSVELWIGQEPQAKIEPVHCFSLSAQQFNLLGKQILKTFAEHYGDDKELKFFAEVVRHDMLNCPIRPCPLYS